MKKEAENFQSELSRVKNCYGCGVCAIACPVQIIKIHLSDEGFYHPVLANEDQCIGCGNCENVCSFLSKEVEAAEKVFGYQAFSVFAKNKDTRTACSSGGVAYEMASKIVVQGGEVAVVRYNTEKHVAEHYLAGTIPQLAVSRGSKYIQSYTLDAFKQIVKSASKIKMVVGMPCQIDSFRRFIRKKKCEKNYLLIDFFCHGVPSMNMWKKYISTVEKDIGNSTSVHFRDKKHGWHNSWAIKIKGARDKNWYSLYKNMDLFYIFFFSNKILNIPCYTCKFRKLKSAADIRVGDLWGQKFKNDLLGVSGVIVFSKEGIDSLKSLANTCHIEAESVQIVMEGQMSGDLSIPRDRWMVMKLLQYPIPLAWIYGLHILPQKAVLKLKRIIKKWL